MPASVGGHPRQLIQLIPDLSYRFDIKTLISCQMSFECSAGSKVCEDVIRAGFRLGRSVWTRSGRPPAWLVVIAQVAADGPDESETGHQRAPGRLCRREVAAMAVRATAQRSTLAARGARRLVSWGAHGASARCRASLPPLPSPLSFHSAGGRFRVPIGPAVLSEDRDMAGLQY